MKNSEKLHTIKIPKIEMLEQITLQYTNVTNFDFLKDVKINYFRKNENEIPDYIKSNVKILV